MAATDPSDAARLPENAYRPLAPGEPYAPIVPASAAPPESTWRAIAWGLVLCVVFTIASAYSGLKVGQVMEASIPISILAIGLARAYRRRSTLLENVILTGTGGTSGAVVAGAIFTLPALYILNLDPHPLQTVLICLAGGCLGILFLIPLRRYFVRDMHGQLPYPEATAITEVLVTGERGGSQAALLLQATAIAGVYDFLVTTFQVWKEYVNLRFVPVVQTLAERAKLAVSFDAVAFILGLGYVMGLRSSMLLCAGGVLSNFVLVPLIWMIGRAMPDVVVSPAAIPIAQMTAEQIFRGYVRFVGVGAIATAGIFGIIKSLRVVIGSFSIAARTFQQGHVAASERTDRDIPMIAVLLGVVISTLVVAAFFTSLSASLPYVLIGTALTVGFSFFFASVAANAIATTARNPVSGMTMLTIIISSVVLLRFGLSGQAGMFFVMAIAGMVCTALSVSGQFITDLKTGYWLGSTPAAQQRVKFLGVIASAVAAGLTIVMLATAFQFGEALQGDTRTVLAAPQASIMKALVEGFMSQQPVAYLLFAAGAMVAVMMEMLGVPPLIVALGMYLPLELNLPALVGGALSHYVGKRAEATGGEDGRSIRERGVIVASGFMAGGALGGVIGAALRLFSWYREDLVKTPFYDIDWISQLVSIAGFLLFCVYLWRRALGARARGGAAAAVLVLVALGPGSSQALAQTPAGPLAHTYSIVARDPATGELGVAVQSHWFAVGSNVTWAEAGVGAIATQSFIEPGYGARGLALLREGRPAAEVLKTLLDADPQRDGRQVAIVDARGRIAAHTGASCIQAAGHTLGSQFSAQANLMGNEKVWPAMADAFGKATGDLADRLLAALDAGEAVGGDIRGRQSAALLVVRATSTSRPWAGGDRVFDLRVDDHPRPLEELRRLVRLQRAYNHANRGDELFSAQKVDAALEEYARAAALAPEIAELPFWQAVTLASAGRDAEALPIFKQVFAKEPRWAELVPRLPASKLLPDDPALVTRILAQRP